MGLNKGEEPVNTEVRVLLPLPQAPHNHKQPTLGTAMAVAPCGTL